MKDIETIVSENVKKILKEFNLNQNELAKIAGVSESTVGKWVLEKASPRMGSIEKIANHFNLPKSYILEEEKSDLMISESTIDYPYLPEPISAGLPNTVDGVTEAETISLPDVIMGKHAGNRDIYITRTNGDSMNRIIPHNSLIAVKPVELHELKDNDIVVYRNHGEYAVKRFEKHDDKLVFRPDSTDTSFTDDVIYKENADDLRIKGKVVLWIVTAD